MIDKLVLIALCLFALIGLLRGAVKEVFGLAGLIFATIAARYFNKPVGEFLSSSFDLDNTVATLAASFLIFFTVAAVFTITGKIITKMLKKSGLGGLNRFVGALLGASKVVIIVGVMLLLADALPEKYKPDIVNEKLDESRFYGLVSEYGPNIVTAVKDTETFQTFMESASENMEEIKEHIKAKGYAPSDSGTDAAGENSANNADIMSNMMSNPEVQKMISNPEVFKTIQDNESLKNLFNNPELMEAVSNGDWSSVFADSKVSEMLNNPELMQQMQEAE